MNKNIKAILCKYPTGAVTLQMEVNRRVNTILRIMTNGSIERYILSSDFIDMSGIKVDNTGKILINNGDIVSPLKPILTGNHKLNLKLSVELFDGRPEFRINAYVYNNCDVAACLLIIEYGGTLFLNNHSISEKYFYHYGDGRLSVL